MWMRRAAGGILWRDDGTIAVIHRPPPRDDWTLPKGKLDRGEPLAAAALREVREETRCEPRLERFSGNAVYPAKGGLKTVTYFNMSLERERPFRPNREIDELRWLAPEAALAIFTYRSDRAVLAAELRRRRATGRLSRAWSSVWRFIPIVRPR